ncbi:MAG: DUF1801 domain-containing protein [Pyrinomonadaceae bacterium]
MAKAKIKTTENNASVDEFLNAVADEQKRTDSRVVLEMMKQATGDEPKMWGPAIIGFGFRTVKSPSGREVDWLDIGFSPRKGNLSLYVLNGAAGQSDLLARLGKYKAGLGCLYIKRLTDVDQGVLEELIEASIGHVRKDQPATAGEG